jgi:hypothetical protein
MSGSSLQVDFVLLFDEAKVLLQFGLNRGRKNGYAIFVSFSLADHDLPITEIEVFHPKPETFEDPQPSAVHERGDQPFRALKVQQNSPDLLACQNDGKPFGSVRTDNRIQPVQLDVEHFPVQDACTGDIWCPGCNFRVLQYLDYLEKNGPAATKDKP